MRLSNESPIGFIGAGKVGTSLAIALHEAGYKVTGSHSKSISSANNLSNAIPNCRTYSNIKDIASNCKILFITTPDDSIESTANSFEPNPYNSLVHCSGAKTIDVFNYVLIFPIKMKNRYLQRLAGRARGRHRLQNTNADTCALRS